MSDRSSEKRRRTSDKPADAAAPEAVDADLADATLQECYDQVKENDDRRRRMLYRNVYMLDSISHFMESTGKEGWGSSDNDVISARAAAARCAERIFDTYKVER
jgi:hypothetical protein